uniref:glycosyltransferase family protein n=1 Tax=Algoriphagus sp. TaxID=1872435 RepID=UPI00404731C0
MIIAYLVPPNYDYLASSVIEGLIEIGHTVYTTENSNYGYYLPRASFRKEAIKCDLLIIGSGRFTDYSHLNGIQHPKTIYIDGSDYPTLEFKPPCPVNLVFKRELLKSDIALTHKLIFPLPFAAEKRYFENVDFKRTIPVSFVCAMSNYMRRSVKQAIVSNFDNAFVGSTGERAYDGISGIAVNTPIYSSILKKSIVSVNVAGKGWDCARYWEIIAHKTCLVTQRLDVQIPNPFIEGQHYLAFSETEELIENVSKLLNNRALVSQLSNEAFKHLCLFHTSKNRAKYLLEMVEKHYVPGKIIDFEGSAELKSRFYYAKNWRIYKAWKSFKPMIPTTMAFKSGE